MPDRTRRAAAASALSRDGVFPSLKWDGEDPANRYLSIEALVLTLIAEPLHLHPSVLDSRDAEAETLVQATRRVVHEHAEPDRNTAIAGGLHYVSDEGRSDASTLGLVDIRLERCAPHREEEVSVLGPRWAEANVARALRVGEIPHLSSLR